MKELFHYRTHRGCDYDSREVEESIVDFVNRDGDLGKLVELLVKNGVVDKRDVFDTFKSFDDFWE